MSRRVVSSGDEEDLDDADNEMFDMDTLTGDEVISKQEVAAKDVNLTIDEVTLAQALATLKSVKPKVKGDVIKEPSIPVSAANAPTKVSAASALIKAKIKTDHELAQRLQAEGQEELLGSNKKQEVDEDKETAELKKIMEIIPDEEEVAIDVVPLASDGKSKMYKIFSHMLKSFSREDLKDLYKLVKAKYESTRPVEDLDLSVIGGD
ncbi:hypothetical protein Tco_1467801 [Tanacetum coccineum]